MLSKYPLLKPQKAAELLGIKLPQLKNLRDNGDIDYYKFGRSYRYKLEDIEDYLRWKLEAS